MFANLRLEKFRLRGKKKYDLSMDSIAAVHLAKELMYLAEEAEDHEGMQMATIHALSTTDNPHDDAKDAHVGRITIKPKRKENED